MIPSFFDVSSYVSSPHHMTHSSFHRYVNHLFLLYINLSRLQCTLELKPRLSDNSLVAHVSRLPHRLYREVKPLVLARVNKF